MPRLKHIAFIVVWTLVAMLACTPSSDIALDALPEQDPPPQVIAQQPLAGEELPIDGSIDIYFDWPMNPSRVEDAVTLDPAVEFTVTWIDDSALRIAPAMPFLRSQQYTVTIGDTARSEDGQRLGEPITLTFQTVGFLRVGEVVPSPNSVGVEADSPITVFFNRPVVPLGLRLDPDTVPHPLRFEPDIPGEGEWLNTSIYIWYPHRPLLGGQRYAATIVAGLEDQTGGTLSEDYIWEFTVLGPEVADMRPSVGDDDLPLDTEVRVTFTQQMDRASTQAAFSLTGVTQDVTGDFAWEERGTVLIFRPDNLLALEANYTITITTEAHAARGGAALSQEFQSGFTTVQSPAVASTSPEDDDDESDPFIEINFTSPIDTSTLTEDLIVISPAPSGEVDVDFNREMVSRWRLNIRLEHSTEYTVTLLPGAADPYGNTIDNTYTFSFTTRPRTPFAHFHTTYDVGFYRAGSPIDVPFLHCNIDQIDLNLYSFSLSSFARMLSGRGYSSDYSPPRDRLISTHTENGGEQDEYTSGNVPITNADDDPLAPGLYLLIADVPQIEGHIRHYMIVGNISITLKDSADEGFAWVTDLDSGGPLEGIPVRFYDHNAHLLAEVATNADGVARADLPYLEEWEPRYAMVQTDNLFGIAQTNWSDGINPSHFGVFGAHLIPQTATTYVYTDRPIYRPGQEVSFRGITRMIEDGGYGLPPDQDVPVTIRNPGGDIIYQESLSFDDFGAFDDVLALDTEAALGYYNMGGAVDGQEFSLGFHVAEYRKPEYEVTVTPENDQALNGDTIRAVVEADYYFGGPVSNAPVQWEVISSSFTIDYEGSGHYSFYDYERDNRGDIYRLGRGRRIANGVGMTDGQGQFIIELPASLEDVSGSRTFVIGAQVFDVAGHSAFGEGLVTVHRGEAYPGVQTERYIGSAGEPQNINLIAIDWGSVPVAEQAIIVTVEQERWFTVREEDELGRVAWAWDVEEVPVGSPQVVTTDAEGRATTTFIPPNGGIYRIRVATIDDNEDTLIASTFVWICGGAFVNWPQSNTSRIELIPDRTNYAPGDIAEILIPSPFQGDVQALITVERERVLDYEVITLSGNSIIYELPITEEMAPDVYVSVFLLRPGDSPHGMMDFRMGLVELNVDPGVYEIDITLTPDREQATPREAVTYTIESRDQEGNPVEAQVSLALVDRATLSLRGPNSSPILEHFYSQRSLGVHTSTALISAVDPIEELSSQGNKGGGGGGMAAYFEVRGDFRDTAYWSADVVTDEDGRAEVTVTLPDNLTTWRMDARAVTQDTLVGQTQTDIVVNMPLMIHSLTPRFFVVGDELAVGAMVNNNTNEEIEATVGLEADGIEVISDATQRVSVPADGRVDVYWDIVVENVEWVDMIFTVEGSGLADASRPTLGDPNHDQQLPVYRWEASETIGTAGQLMEASQQVEGIALPPTYEVTQGHLDIQVNPSLVAGMADGLDWLENYPYECTEQTVSRFLPNALTLRAYREIGIHDPELEENLSRVANEGLQRLYNQQRLDGGWGWWPTSNSSSPNVSAYALLGMVAAEEAGIMVDDNVRRQAIDYLNTALDTGLWFDEQAFILYVLARANAPSISRTVQLYNDHGQLGHFSRAWLAQALWLIDSDSRVDVLMDSLQTEAILNATGTHWEEVNDYRWIWNTDTRSTAIILSAYANIRPESDLAPNIVRWLMAARRAGHWETTQETAWALIALTDWVSATGELDANYDFIVELNGETVADGVTNAETLRQSTRLTIDVGELLRDEVNRLTFARGEGAGRMYYTAHLTAYLPIEEVEPLSRGIIISRQYLDADGEPITEAQIGDLITVRLTIIAPNDLYYVAVEDPIPAGTEAVNAQLLTESLSAERPRIEREEPLAFGWGWWWFARTEMRDEKTVMFADYLPAGTYEYTYQIRALLAGEYHVIPSNAYEFYFPEVSGHGEGLLFTITEPE